MRFIEVSGFSVRRDRQRAFQQWVAANEERIKKSYPEGCEFGGIYGTVYSSDKEGGDSYWLEIYDSYAALDRSAAVQKDPTSEYATITEEALQFMDPDRHAGWSHHLLKSITEATVFDQPVK